MSKAIAALADQLAIYQLLFPPINELEWSATRSGPGDGPHGSGGGGTKYAACPWCFQLKEPNGNFMREAVGHNHDCKLAIKLGAKRNPVPKGETGVLDL